MIMIAEPCVRAKGVSARQGSLLASLREGGETRTRDAANEMRDAFYHYHIVPKPH